MRPAAESATGTIYDIGYQRYTGARLGRGHAFRTLFGHSLRQAWGIGRRGRALLVPFGILTVILFPALLQVLLDTLSGGDAKLIGYADYFGFVQGMVVLFCAAQAPELVSNDQHDRVLPLYFSRPMARADYAAAKLGAMVTAVWLLVALPLAVLFVGRISAARNTEAALRAESASVLPILGTTLVIAAVMGAVSVALASLTARRALATASVFALMLMTTVVADILDEAWKEGGDYAMLASPVGVVMGVIRWFFGPPEGPRRGPPVPPDPVTGEMYGIAAVVLVALASAAIFARYAKVRA